MLTAAVTATWAHTCARQRCRNLHASSSSGITTDLHGESNYGIPRTSATASYTGHRFVEVARLQPPPSLHAQSAKLQTGVQTKLALQVPSPRFRQWVGCYAGAPRRLREPQGATP